MCERTTSLKTFDAVSGEARLPARLLPYLQGAPYREDEVGRSGSRVLLAADKVLKIERSGEESDNERAMYAFLQGKLPVPRVYESFCEDGVSYLLMERAAGEMACARERLKDPAHTVHLLAEGLKLLWRVDVKGCPADQRLCVKLPRAAARLAAGLVDPTDTEPGTLPRFGSLQALYRHLDENRPQEDLVFSHGDYCLPNVFLNADAVGGFIDLGRSGVADRYQDIALCVRSMEHNFGTARYTDRLFEELGIARDDFKIDYYILLDELF